MKVFLRFVGDPGFQIGIAEDFGISQSSVSRIVSEVAEKIVETSENWIKFPMNTEENDSEKSLWQQKNIFPSCIGAIYCTHVRISKPRQHSGEYVNRKGFHSINVQATCNGAEKFTSGDVSWSGSVHDSRIFKNSAIYQVLLSNPTCVLIADEGYGITPFIMTPFRRTSTNVEENYNSVLIKERVIIERAFGQLKQKFPCLQYKLRISTQNAPKVILACFVLYNISKHFLWEVESSVNYETEQITASEVSSYDSSRRSIMLTEQGKRRRN